MDVSVCVPIMSVHSAHLPKWIECVVSYTILDGVLDLLTVEEICPRGWILELFSCLLLVHSFNSHLTSRHFSAVQTQRAVCPNSRRAVVPRTCDHCNNAVT